MYRPGLALVKQSTKLVVHGKLEPQFPRLGAGEEVVEMQIQIQIQIQTQIQIQIQLQPKHQLGSICSTLTSLADIRLDWHFMAEI